MSSSQRVPVILLVEDSDDDAYFFQRALKKSGTETEVLRLQNGRAAADYLASNRPEIVFLDLKLPGLSGFDVLRSLADRGASDPPPVIVLSGSDHSGDIARATGLGARDYLVKPVDWMQLRRLLGVHAQNRVEEVPS